MVKRFGWALALVLVLGLGVGCSSKQVIQEPQETTAPSLEGSATAVERAAETITSGIIYFDFDKFDIKPEYRDILRQKAELMKAYPSIRVRIEGNCDARGTQEYNLALGERRARAAYEFMVMLGVNPAQLEIISYGKERPAVDGTGPAVWAQNRRDNFVVIAR